MSSTASSSGSSTAEPAPPRAALGGGDRSDRRRPRVYTGPDYRLALAGPLEAGVHRDPGHPPFAYRLLFALARLALRLLFRYRVEGLENVPRAPFIIAANHQTWYDALLVIAAFPRLPMIYTMARRDTVFDTSVKRRLVPLFGVFPIEPSRGELDERGVATVYRLLGRGAVVLLFPEGRYSRGRELRPLRKGVAHFALQAGVPICPVAVTGIGRLRPFGRLEVSIGRPILPDPPGWWTVARRVERVLDQVRRGILHAFAEPPAGRGRLRRLGAGLERGARAALRRTRPRARGARGAAEALDGG